MALAGLFCSGQLGDQFEALGLAAGEGGAGLADFEVSEAGFLEEAERDGDLGVVGEAIHGFGPVGYRPYSDTERAVLRSALGRCSNTALIASRPQITQSSVVVSPAEVGWVGVVIMDVLLRRPNCRPV